MMQINIYFFKHYSRCCGKGRQLGYRLVSWDVFGNCAEQQQYSYKYLDNFFNLVAHIMKAMPLDQNISNRIILISRNF